MQKDRFSYLGSSGDRPESLAEAAIEHIASQWDGFFYENSFGGDIDIGAAIREAFDKFMTMERAQPSSDSPASGRTGQSEKDGCSVSTLQARITELEEALDDLLDLVQWSVSSDSPAMVRAIAALKEPSND
jgi:hypothetical protein